jgi:hypothetical protein
LGKKWEWDGVPLHLAFKKLEGDKPYVGVVFAENYTSLYVEGMTCHTTNRGLKSLFTLRESERTQVIEALAELAREVADADPEIIKPLIKEQASRLLAEISLQMQAKGMRLAIAHRPADAPTAGDSSAHLTS